MMNNDSPLIGVSCCVMHEDRDRILFNGRRLVYLEESMLTWLNDAGATAVMLPNFSDVEGARRVLAKMDGVVLSGGVDIGPENYQESPVRPEWAGDSYRDKSDLLIARTCWEIGKPLLGICRGAQLINVARGGSLFQDISLMNEGALVHRDAVAYEKNHHEVTFVSGKKLADIFGGVQGGMINSVHHQGVKSLGDGLEVVATSTQDGIVEAFWATEGSYTLGIQWHPEFQSKQESNLLDPQLIANDFIEACRRK